MAVQLIFAFKLQRNLKPVVLPEQATGKIQNMLKIGYTMFVTYGFESQRYRIILSLAPMVAKSRRNKTRVTKSFTVLAQSTAFDSSPSLCMMEKRNCTADMYTIFLLHGQDYFLK
jgi:hypothetical protein